MKQNAIPLIQRSNAFMKSFSNDQNRKQMFSCLILTFFKLNVMLSVCFIKACMWSSGPIRGQGLLMEKCLCFGVKLLRLDKWCLFGIVKYRAIPVNVRSISCNETWGPVFCL